MKNKKYLFIFFFLSAYSAQASVPLLQQSLLEAEHQAKKSSGILKSASATAEATKFQANSVSSALFPNLSLQGNYSYQTEVPSLTIGPVGTLTFGTHNNYSAGPVLSYTLFDGGKNLDSSKSADLLTQARRESYRAQEKQLELSVRQAYFRVQYALRQLEVTADSLRLSQAQAYDIDLRFNAGASSKLDQTQSHRDVINYQLKFQQVQNDLAASLRELMALTGSSASMDTARPIPEKIAAQLPDGVEEPSLRVNLDSLKSSLNEFKSSIQSDAKLGGPIVNHPEIRAYDAEIASSQRAAKSEKGGLWPKLSLTAKSQYIYPDAVVPQTKLQNTFMATLSLPLFEADASRSRAAQKASEAMATQFLREQRKTDMERDYVKAHDVLLSLESQEILSERNVSEAQEVERLTYQSYKAGKSRYLDVQDANLKLLEAEVNSAQIQSSLLNAVAVMAYLENQTNPEADAE